MLYMYLVIDAYVLLVAQVKQTHNDPMMGRIIYERSGVREY